MAISQRRYDKPILLCYRTFLIQFRASWEQHTTLMTHVPIRWLYLIFTIRPKASYFGIHHQGSASSCITIIIIIIVVSRSIFPTLWGWTVHFLDGSPPCWPVSWVNVGDIGRSSFFCDCFSPCFVGSPTWFPPSNWEILNSLEPVGLFCPSHMSIPSQSALPHHLSYPYQAHCLEEVFIFFLYYCVHLHCLDYFLDIVHLHYSVSSFHT